jgi:hypothetical protein
VAILRALATAPAYEEECRLVAELREGSSLPRGWRLIEDYCAVDPCDPASTEPSNVRGTADRYAEVGAGHLASREATTEDDAFFEDARPGVVRFHPDVAIAAHRRFARAVFARRGRPRVLGMTELRQHAALLETQDVDSLIDVARGAATPDVHAKDKLERDWFTAQLALQLAFVHLDGNRQLDVLTSLPPHGPLLLDLLPTFSPADPDRLALALQAAAETGHEDRLLGMLAFAHRSGTPLTADAKRAVAVALVSPSSVVRSEAMAASVDHDDADLLNAAIDSGWSAGRLDPRNQSVEVWAGSRVMVRAAERGLIEIEDAIARMSPRLFSWAAQRLGDAAVQEIMPRLDLAVRKALAADGFKRPPRVEGTLQDGPPVDQPLLALASRQPDETRDALRRLAETPEQFLERQRSGWARYEAFDAALTAKAARLVVDDPGAGAVRACVESAPAWGEAVAEVLLAASAASRSQVRNFAIMLAEALARHAPVLAARLFTASVDLEGYVRLTHGPSQIPIEAISVWRADGGEAWDALRRRRLDQTRDDHALAQEVLAASLVGRRAFLAAYVREELAAPEPVRQMRALMVVGFGEPDEQAISTLRTYAAQEGYLGNAAKSALAAYQRGAWARHWRDEMRSAPTAEAFWRSSVLFLEVVDGRFELDGRTEAKETISGRLYPLLKARLERKLKRRKDKRQNSLGGHKPPEDYILVHA